MVLKIINKRNKIETVIKKKKKIQGLMSQNGCPTSQKSMLNISSEWMKYRYFIEALTLTPWIRQSSWRSWVGMYLGENRKSRVAADAC